MLWDWNLEIGGDRDLDLGIEICDWRFEFWITNLGQALGLGWIGIGIGIEIGIQIEDYI